MRKQFQRWTAPAPLPRKVQLLSILFAGFVSMEMLFRALLADTKILALDEATANVDRTTDALIQKSLHALIAQNDKTLLIIAHRIDTIMCCEQLLVLHNGSLVESGSPSELTARSNGVFARMVRAAANASEDVT